MSMIFQELKFVGNENGKCFEYEWKREIYVVFFLSKSSCIFSLNERKSVDYVVASEIYLFQEDFCVTLQRSGTGEVKERRDIRKNSVLIKSHVRIPKYFMFE